MTLDRPQIHTIVSHPLNYSPYDIKWIPCSAKVVCTGHMARGTGAIEIFELNGTTLDRIKTSERKSPIKCATFGASPLHTKQLATGDFEGTLAVFDMERLETPVFSVKAHDAMINCIDGCGGVGVNTGPPEIVTASRDGTVKVWDTRQKDQPVAVVAPAKGETSRDAWTVAFGNSWNNEERVVCAGYENGDLKMFNLKTMSLMYETNLKNGICALEFDRRDIKMNKLVAATLEANVHVFDVRTHHPKTGFASTTFKHDDNITIWMVKHLPQNRDIFVSSAGSGGINLLK